MSPILPARNFADGYIVNAVAFTQLLLGDSASVVLSADDKYLLVSEFGFANPATSCLSSLGGHIGHVLLVCPNPEMCGVHASSVVAAGAIVANLKAGRDTAAFVQFPGQAVSEYGTATWVTSNPVTISSKAAGPRTAAIGAGAGIYEGEEVVGKGMGTGSIGAYSSAEPPFSMIDSKLQGKEGGAALFAGALDSGVRVATRGTRFRDIMGLHRSSPTQSDGATPQGTCNTAAALPCL